jgi:segregation and condensation protein A
MNIRIEKFEGPLALLLKLIEKEEMDITEISLAGIADEFVDYIRQADNIDAEEMADFLVVAAKLLLIKSKALLPYLYPEEEAEIEEFEQELRIYKEYLEAAKQVEQLLGKKKFMFQREFNRKAVALDKAFSPPAGLSTELMKECLSALVLRLRPAEKLKEKRLEKKVSIEDKIMSIQALLSKRIQLSFHQLFEVADNKTDVIVSFLAALELMRQREVRLEQAEMFGEIRIERW